MEFPTINTGFTYLAVFENHHGSKEVLEVTATYSDTLFINVADLPDGYFFRDNFYQLKLYETEEDRQCDLAMNLCGYQDCITLKVKDISGVDNTNITLECC